MGVDAPLSGVASGMLAPFGAPIELSEFIHPRVEPEIAFVLARDVAVPATVSSVLAAAESVYGAIDVLDSRYEDFRFVTPDVIADNASAARFLVGPRSVPPGDLEDLRLLGVYSVRTETSRLQRPAAVMGHPAASVAWLANQLAERGEVLKADDRILRRLDGTHPALADPLSPPSSTGWARPGIHRTGTRVVHTARKDLQLSRFGVALMQRALILFRYSEPFHGPELGGELPRKAPTSHGQRTRDCLEVGAGFADSQLDRRSTPAPAGEDRHGDCGCVGAVFIARSRDLRQTDDGQCLAKVVRRGHRVRGLHPVGKTLLTTLLGEKARALPMAVAYAGSAGARPSAPMTFWVH